MMALKKIFSIFLVLGFFMAFGPEIFSAQKQSPNSILININTAGVEQLIKLPQIGEKIAQRIIDFRKKNGKFLRIEELMKVKGIGEKVFAKVKDQITV